jgi:elongation factor Ts
MSTIMAVTAEQVKKLRDMTGAGMGDCKKALEEAAGNEQEAVEILRKKGAASAAKRADRIAKEGMIVAAVSEDGSRAAIAEVNCETDFVARNDSFAAFAVQIAHAALTHAPNSHEAFLSTKLENGTAISEEVGAQTGRLGEKIEARRFKLLHAKNGIITSYIHPGSKLGVLVALEGVNGETGKTIGREIAMQIAAMNPMAANRNEIDATTIEKELDIYRTQLRNEGKKEDIIDRIATGKLEKFYQDYVLVEQSFIKDASKTVKDVLKEAGEGAAVSGFVRMQLGEGASA